MLQFIEPHITNFDAQLSTVRFLRARVLMYLQYTKLCNYILHLGESSLSIKNCGSRPRPGRCASVPEKRNRKSRPARAVNPLGLFAKTSSSSDSSESTPQREINGRNPRSREADSFRCRCGHSVNSPVNIRSPGGVRPLRPRSDRIFLLVQRIFG